MRNLVPAARVAAAAHYEQTFGKLLNEFERRPGRPKSRTAQARTMAKVFDPGRLS
jgi:hypothetical protein